MPPYLLLTLAPLFWSGNWLAGRGLHDVVSPVGLNFWRWTIALCVLVVIVAPTWREKRPIYLQHWKQLFLLGVLGIGIFQVLVYYGLKYTSVINAVVLNSTMPVFMVLTSWIMLRHTITWRQALGGAISFLGILVIVSRGDWETIRNIEFSFGDALILAAMPVWAVYSTVLSRTKTGLSGMETLAAMTVFALLASLPFYLVDTFIAGNGVPFTWNVIAVLAFIGTISSVGAFYCWNEGVRGAGPNAAGFMYHLLPAFATAGAVLVLNEQLFLFQAIGIALILVGVFTSARKAQGSS